MPQSQSHRSAPDQSLRDPQERDDESYQDYTGGRPNPRHYDRDYFIPNDEDARFNSGFERDRFLQDYKRYSAYYHDNDYGPPGIDEDFGTNQGGPQQWIGLRNLDAGTVWTREEENQANQEERPNYSGRGPRGYTPSDVRMREGICDALTDDRFVDASDIEVEVTDGIAMLAGTVPERAMKRAAEDLAEGIPGVKDVRNGIKVITRSVGKPIAEPAAD